jgi:hypothetical protein
MAVDDYPRKLLDSFAQSLMDPTCTEVEFIFPAIDKRLYAMGKILEDRSKYFKRSITPIL